MRRFNSGYMAAAALLLITEILIARYMHDRFVRPWVGDMLVVILLYCLVKSCWNTPVVKTAVAVLLFSFVVETLQYFHIVRVLGLEQFALARIIIGTSFEWTDLLAYTVGIGLVLLVEYKRLPLDKSRRTV